MPQRADSSQLGPPLPSRNGVFSGLPRAKQLMAKPHQAQTQPPGCRAVLAPGCPLTAQARSCASPGRLFPARPFLVCSNLPPFTCSGPRPAATFRSAPGKKPGCLGIQRGSTPRRTPESSALANLLQRIPESIAVGNLPHGIPESIALGAHGKNPVPWVTFTESQNPLL